MNPPDSPRRPWDGRRIVLGVTGGIAAYKSIGLARRLTRLGAEVDVVLTKAAQRFVTPLTFEGVTGRAVLTDLFSVEGAARHIRLGREADVICVAPATADFLARAAQGRADDLLTTTLLVGRVPVLLCPAMNDRMWAHAQVQANGAHCRDVLGYEILGPDTGPLAVGEADGPGRLVEPDVIVDHLGRLLTPPGPLEGVNVVVTSGPTREALDPVRYLGNRSSGRMGFALAEAAWRRGARVTVVSGPTSLPEPTGVDVVPVESAREMARAVEERIAEARVAIYAAAVADYRPVAEPSSHKRKRDGEDWAVDLTQNPDIAATSIRRLPTGGVAVGFALETHDLVDHARQKLLRKGFDLVVANPANEEGAGFGAPTNRVTLVTEDEAEALPLLPKAEVAERILDRVEAFLDPRDEAVPSGGP